jgi:hypothetical protein
MALCPWGRPIEEEEDRMVAQPMLLKLANSFDCSVSSGLYTGMFVLTIAQFFKQKSS